MNGDDCLRGFDKWVNRIDFDYWCKLADLFKADKVTTLKAEQWLEEYYIEHVFGQDVDSDALYEAWKEMQDEIKATND